MRVLVWFQSVWMTSQLSTWLSTHRTSSVGSYFVGLLLVFLSYFVPPLLVLREKWTTLILASWWLFLAALSTLHSCSLGHWSLGAWSIPYSLCPYGCQYFLFILCILFCYLWFSSQLLSSRTGNLQSYQTAPGVTDLTGNLSYSQVRTCDGSSMELRCLLFIAVAFAFIFLKNFNKPLTFLLMWGPPNPRFHPFNVYWRDLRRTVVFHSSRKSCTLFVKLTGLLWSRLSIKPPKGFWRWLLVQTLGDYATLRKPSCTNTLIGREDILPFLGTPLP